MKHIIFYSWQSDLDPALTRNFIEEALERAGKAIATKHEVRIDAEIDRDTAGITGTPAITGTILRKIDTCDVFVCDVSTINTPEDAAKHGFWSSLARAVANVVLQHTQKVRGDKRLTPNPNVLVELGYAVARIGWDRVILVQNTFYGGIETLPFDPRGRRVVAYCLPSKEAGCEKRPQLRDDMASAAAGPAERGVVVQHRGWFRAGQHAGAGVQRAHLSAALQRDSWAGMNNWDLSVLKNTRRGDKGQPPVVRRVSDRDEPGVVLQSEHQPGEQLVRRDYGAEGHMRRVQLGVKVIY